MKTDPELSEILRGWRVPDISTRDFRRNVWNRIELSEQSILNQIYEGISGRLGSFFGGRFVAASFLIFSILAGGGLGARSALADGELRYLKSLDPVGISQRTYSK